MSQLQKLATACVLLAGLVLLGPYFGLHILSRAPVDKQELDREGSENRRQPSRSSNRPTGSKAVEASQARKELLSSPSSSPSQARKRTNSLSELEDLLGD